MNTKPQNIKQSDHIEIELNKSGNVKLTVSSYHAVELLTYLQQQGLQAVGQNPPLFGFDNFPTIYYINFHSSFQNIEQEVLSYLNSKSIPHSRSLDDDGTNTTVRLTL